VLQEQLKSKLKTMKVIREVHRGEDAFKFKEWIKIHICREFVPLHYTLAEKNCADISTI